MSCQLGVISQRSYSYTNTSETGYYSFSSLPDGTYNIQASHPDYLTQTSPSYDAEGSASLNISLNLPPKIVGAYLSYLRVNGVLMQGEPYYVNLGDTLHCEASVWNSGNVTAHYMLETWSSEISLEPELISSEWVQIDPDCFYTYNMDFVVDTTYLNGTKNVTLLIKAWDSSRPQSTEYPASYVEAENTFQVSSHFKKAVISLIDFDKPAYEPLDEVNIAVKLKNNGENSANFNVQYYISDVPMSQDEINGFFYTSSQSGIILQTGQELLLDRLHWTIPPDGHNKGYYLFVNLTCVSGDDIIQYDAPIVTFYCCAVPTIVKNIARHYRPVGTEIQIIPVNVEGADYYAALYYDQDTAVLYDDGGSSWIGGYTGLEFMTVIDTQGAVIRQQGDVWRKALFTAMASHIMLNGEAYWVEVLAQIEELYNWSQQVYDVHNDYINEQINDLEQKRLLCKIGSFISGLGASAVGGPAVAGKAITEVSLKSSLYTYVIPRVLGEIAQAAGSGKRQYSAPDPGPDIDELIDLSLISDVGSLDEASERYSQMLTQGGEDRFIITIAIFVAFVVADILFRYFDSVYAADLTDVQTNANLILPPLQRMMAYLKGNPYNNNGYCIGRIIYDKLVKFKYQKPSYANICQVLGWGIEDPFGITNGDLSSSFFNYYSSGITEKLAYLDGVNTIDGNNTFLSQIDISQEYFSTLNLMNNRYFLMKGSIYFDSYSLGQLGLEKMNQIDTGNFYQNGYAMTINTPQNTSVSPLPLEVTVYYNGAPVTTADLSWSIAGTGIFGYMLHQGNGVYVDEADISSLLAVSGPALYRIDFVADADGEEIEGFTYFHILPQNAETVYYALPNPYAMNPDETALYSFLEENYASVVLFSLNDLSYNPIDPEDIPLLIFFNNTSSIPAQYGNSNFKDNIASYLQSGGNLALFGNAAEILDQAGLTNAMFNNMTFCLTADNSSYNQTISNFSHPATYGLF
ncbi:MAG TPA: carboxypeptidase-like regulatory domain-containing protein, partial [Candidatus Syntrophosphaera sp.]|nr:carboxypeptidase-like regulatory domain-containing protein [Candidatus Syntrophosphaera sp.]